MRARCWWRRSRVLGQLVVFISLNILVSSLLGSRTCRARERGYLADLGEGVLPIGEVLVRLVEDMAFVEHA